MSRPIGERVLTFEVRGEPQPQGSVSAWVPTDKRGEPYRRGPTPRNPRGAIIVNVTTDNKDLKAWRQEVAKVAVDELAACRCGMPHATTLGPNTEHADECPMTEDWRFPLEGVGFTLEAISFMPSPKGRWGTGRNEGALKDSAVAHPMTKPDVDKLLRAFLDALTGVVWKDDSQVTDAITRKRYAVPVGPDDDGVRAAIAVWINAEQTGADLRDEERIRWVSGPVGQGALL